MSLLKLSTQSWSSQTVFIMAAVGSAVGLGNIWKFPYIVGENGGGAFVLVYLACILVIGLPILLSELALGRAGQANPVQAMANLAQESKANRLWTLLGFNGVFSGMVILTFYSVIAGLAVAYFYNSVRGVFIDMDVDSAQTLFAQTIADPWVLLFWHSLVMLFTIAVVARGIRGGLEKTINFMMPGLLLILLVLVGYASSTGYFMQSFYFLFTPDFSKLTWQAVLIAMGHAFFTLSIGFGTMMAYGAYVDRKISLVRASVWIVMMDTVIALLAGLVIFSVVFANQLEPGMGPGLLFQTLPIAFGQMEAGWLFGSLFFLLVVMAALSSTISMMEPALSWLEQNWNMSRLAGTWFLGGIAWFVGLGTVLSFNLWQDVHFLGERHFFDSLDFLTSSILLPLGGLLMGVFMAWTLRTDLRQAQITLQGWRLSFFMLTLRYITPIAIMIVFAHNLAPMHTVWLASGLVLLYLAYIYQVERARLLKGK